MYVFIFIFIYTFEFVIEMTKIETKIRKIANCVNSSASNLVDQITPK